jgi:hypothetical protein
MSADQPCVKEVPGTQHGNLAACPAAPGRVCPWAWKPPTHTRGESCSGHGTAPPHPTRSTPPYTNNSPLPADRTRPCEFVCCPPRAVGSCLECFNTQAGVCRWRMAPRSPPCVAAHLLRRQARCSTRHPHSHHPAMDNTTRNRHLQQIQAIAGAHWGCRLHAMGGAYGAGCCRRTGREPSRPPLLHIQRRSCQPPVLRGVWSLVVYIDKTALAWGIIHDLKLSTQLLCTQAACLPWVGHSAQYSLLNAKRLTAHSQHRPTLPLPPLLFGSISSCAAHSPAPHAPQRRQPHKTHTRARAPASLLGICNALLAGPRRHPPQSSRHATTPAEA